MKHRKLNYFDITYELEEIWKPIPNYEGLYEASNFGRIRTSANKTTYTKKHGERHWKQRILKYKTNNENTYKTGYRVSLWKNGKSKTYLVARLIGATFIKDELLNNKLTINHIDGNRLNNRVENLEWCSLSDNIKKGFEQGLYPSKPVLVYNKNTKEAKVYSSLSKAARSMNRNTGYISNLVKQNKNSNKDYYWVVLDKRIEGINYD